MNRTLLQALRLFALVTVVLGILHLLGVGLWLLFGLALLVALTTLFMPRTGMRWLDGAITQVRTWLWATEQGRHHSFGGVPLHIDDDGLHPWLDGEGLQRVLGTHDSEQVLAARHAGRWQRSHDGRLMLRVDAVVQHLNTMPGREAPRVQRLRRYLERDVLFPAQQRRRA